MKSDFWMEVIIFSFRKDMHAVLLYAKPLPTGLCTNNCWQLCRSSSSRLHWYNSSKKKLKTLTFILYKKWFCRWIQQGNLSVAFISHQLVLSRWTTMVRGNQSTLTFGTRLARCSNNHCYPLLSFHLSYFCQGFWVRENDKLFMHILPRKSMTVFDHSVILAR